MAAAIKNEFPNAQVIKNRVPKSWAMEDIYCQLIPNDDENDDCYSMIPRIGAFEISWRGVLVFSKMMTSVWPHFTACGKQVGEMLENIKRGMSLQEVKQKYTTNGKVTVQPRKNNATKSSGFGMSQPVKAESTPAKQAPAAQPAPAEAAPAQEAPASNEAAPAKNIMAGSHLNIEDIQNVADGVCLEFPADCNSALKKCLNNDIWQKYKSATDKGGASFAQAIFSGVKNVDSGIGVYATSHDAYYSFAPLFDQIIENYHGHGPSATHKSDMNPANL